MGARKPLQVAHRGGSGLWPENTLVAFARAIEAGVDGIELDVHLSADGVLVVHHDESLKPQIARGPDGAWLNRPTPLIKELSYDELQAYDVGRLRPDSSYGARYPEQEPFDGERIPALADVFSLVRRRARPDFRIYLELKTALLEPETGADPVTLADAAVALAYRMDMVHQIVFVSFDWRALAEARRLAPEIPNAFTTLPFFQVDPEDPSAAHDEADSETAQLRAAMADGPDWLGDVDWRTQPGAGFAEKTLNAIQASGGDGWFAWHGDVTLETVAIARELGLAVSAWTVDEPDEMQRLTNLAVDAILTDRQDRLMRVLAC